MAKAECKRCLKKARLTREFLIWQTLAQDERPWMTPVLKRQILLYCFLFALSFLGFGAFVILLVQLVVLW